MLPVVDQQSALSDKETRDPHRHAAWLEWHKGKPPSLSYSLLSHIIQHTATSQFTTNFDNLVADALAMHAQQAKKRSQLNSWLQMNMQHFLTR
jgi:hypothetical protein